jgi:prepilin-type N-terminal cleavage/methylation domain-containing protein
MGVGKKTEQNKNSQSSGFTLIEILVVIGLLAIIATIGSNMFFTTLRSSTKSKSLTVVKQNGDYALATMEKLIRDSEKVITNSDGSLCTTDMNKIKTKRLDGSEVEFSCEGEGTVDGLIASNSARLISSDVKLDSCSFDCSSQGDFYPQVVTINFTLSQAAVTARLEEQASINFKTTVTTRNF